MTSLSDSTLQLDQLAAIVREHRVCWETLPLMNIDPEEGAQHIGFEIDLYATSIDPRLLMRQESVEWKHLFEDLRKVAAWVADNEEHLSVRIDPFDSSTHQSPRRNFRREVELTIEFESPDGEVLDPKVEKATMQRLEKRMTAIGIRREQWI